MDTLTQKLSEAGFYKFEKNLAEIWVELKSRCLKTSSGDNESNISGFDAGFDALPSCIPSNLPSTKAAGKSGNAILIDFGGSNTRVALAVNHGQQKSEFVPLGYFSESEIRSLIGEDSQQNKKLSIFTGALLERVKPAIAKLGIKIGSINSVGICWSNFCRNLSASENNLDGITGIVAGKDDPNRYAKGEMYIADLENGDDIGRLVVDGFYSKGYQVNSIVVTNDTVATWAACEAADAGVIISTGANTTFIINDEVFNAEIGGGFIVKKEFLTPYDVKKLIIAGTGKLIELEDVPIEYLTSGMGIGKILTSYVSGLKDFIPGLTAIGNFTVENNFSFEPRHLSGLIKDQIEIDPGRKLNAGEAAILKQLSGEIMNRAAMASALLIAASTVHQSEKLKDDDSLKRKNLKIALDSRLVLEFPGFLEAIRRNLKKIEADNAYTIELMNPGVLESVPLQGVANLLSRI